MLNLPKNPKADDLVPILTDLEARIVALEAYVVRNDNRITALEGRQSADAHNLAEHQAGAVERQAEINDLRWAITHGRKSTRRR